MKHDIGDCPLYRGWINENQPKLRMFNSEKNQLCSDCKDVVYGESNNMTQTNWEKEFDEGCNADNISDPPTDRVWIKSFINQLLEKRDKELVERVAEYQMDLCENSQEFKDFVLRLLTNDKNK